MGCVFASFEEYCHSRMTNYVIAESDSGTLVIPMDLQAVLLSPALLVSALYFKTKLAMHNFTIYYSTGNNDVDCYVWHKLKLSVRLFV